MYKAFDKSNNKYVAIKKISLKNKLEGIPVNALREIVLLKGLNSPYIVNLTDYIIENQKVFLIFDFYLSDL